MLPKFQIIEVPGNVPREQEHSHNPQASKIWLEKLENVSIETVKEIFERIPEERSTDTAKEFAIRLSDINRRRLLELKR